MSEDERHEMIRTVDEAHAGLKELVLRLRRHTPKSPAQKAAVKAEQEVFQLQAVPCSGLTSPIPCRRLSGAGRCPKGRQRPDKVIDFARLRR